ncbi:hypothetical protein GCM10009547_11790 [Sporichthya brevicatena]|uniref:Uncharacterized protein n=1 Tax=Sporichthya brevicatena TaxID=171442 RepID=A0ABN1GH29_9ACTN
MDDEVAAQDGQAGVRAVQTDVARAGRLRHDVGDDHAVRGPEVLVATPPETKTAAVRTKRIDGGGDGVRAELLRRAQGRGSGRGGG